MSVSFDGRTLILTKMQGWKTFNARPRHQYRVCQWDECVYGAQPQKKWWLLGKSMFVTFDGWTLTLRKMAGWKAFNVKPNHQYRASKWWKIIYGALSQKERRLFWESMFASFDGWTLVLRKIEGR